MVRCIVNARSLGWVCGILVMMNALLIFGQNIYPILANGNVLAENLSNFRFDLTLITQEIAAYFLVVVGTALPGRSRVSWWASFIILVFILANHIWHQHILGDSFVPIVATMLILLACYRWFDRSLYLSYSFVFIFAFIIFALCFGTLGSYVLRSDFKNLNTLGDALYFTLVTYSTVGYGDILPQTTSARYFVIAMIVMGLIMFTSGITIIAYMLNVKLKNVLFQFNKGKVAMSNHIIFMGYNVFTKILLTRFHKSGEQCLLIDQQNMDDVEHQHLIEEGQFLLTSYPGNSEILLRARAAEAKLIIVSFERDADTMFALMNLQDFLADHAPRPKIIARVFYEENIQKAERAGADKVVAPHLLVADAIMDYLK